MTEVVNAFLFRGEIRGYWRLVARGANARAIVQHRHSDRRFDFGVDGDGMARRNGGIVNPTDRTIAGGHYLYRFVDTCAYSQDKSTALMGRWWMDEHTWRLLREAARPGGMSLEAAAQIFLALPDEWGDRGRIARGKLTAPLMVWSGTGNVASGRLGAHTPAQHNKAVQLFVPGEPKVIARAFGGVEKVECIYTREVPKGQW